MNYLQFKTITSSKKTDVIVQYTNIQFVSPKEHIRNTNVTAMCGGGGENHAESLSTSRVQNTPFLQLNLAVRGYLWTIKRGI
jgi:hypothetical protein